MKEAIIKLIIFSVLAILGGFIDAFFKDKNIDITYAIYFILGWISCLML